VLKRLLPVFAAVGAVGVSQALAEATSVRVQLFPFTREVRIQNRDAAGFSFALYTISSPGGTLNGANGIWTSIADTYDASGNGFIDPANNWLELSASSTELTEGVFAGPGGTLPAFRSLSLGKIWDSGLLSVPDVGVSIFLPSGQPATVELRQAIDGDYNEDLAVDAADYDVWKAAFGSATEFRADGNLDGIVDAADYTIWRNNFGQSLPSGSGSGLAVGGSPLVVRTIVPEPSAAMLALAAGVLLVLRRRRTA